MIKSKYTKRISNILSKNDMKLTHILRAFIILCLILAGLFFFTFRNQPSPNSKEPIQPPTLTSSTATHSQVVQSIQESASDTQSTPLELEEDVTKSSMYLYLKKQRTNLFLNRLKAAFPDGLQSDIIESVTQFIDSEAKTHLEMVTRVKQYTEEGIPLTAHFSLQELYDIHAMTHVDTHLDALLSHEQKLIYEAFKTKEKENSSESSALKSLTVLDTKLSLSDEQKDAIYSRLHEEMQDIQTKPSDYFNPTDILSGTTENLAYGIEVWSELNQDQLFQGLSLTPEILAGNEALNDAHREELLQVMRRTHQGFAEQKIGRFKDILTEEQMDSYRSQLIGMPPH